MKKASPRLQRLPIEKLQRGQYQPRRQFDEASLEELAQSIRSSGLLQPIVVRALAAGQYEIIAGERRWRAAQLAELSEVDCLIHQLSDSQAAEATTIENIIRVDLNPIEEAQAYLQLSDEFGYTQDEIAYAVGKSRAKIANSLRLLNLAPPIQQHLIDGHLSEGHGKVLAGVADTSQRRLAQQCLDKGWSVRRLEAAIKAEAATGSKPIPPPKDQDIQHLESSLTEHIGSAVNIDYSPTDGKGKLVIDFHNLDILEGIFQKFGFKTTPEKEN